MTGTIADYSNQVTTGDTAAAVVYSLTDADGAICRSAPQVLANALVWNEGVNLNASGQWIRIPTLRHLLPGTVAQIEIYIGQVDLQLYRVIANDPTVDHINFCVQTQPDGSALPNNTMVTVAAAVSSYGYGEDLYTTGNAIPNDAPPQLQCLTVWRNRAVGAFANQIWPSQEFADGLGIQWTNYTRLEWNEGTGDITGICQIDWNYLAVFKIDAIGIIDGAGPDGMGHGNYIVRTLTTKAGTVNARSLVNGADGCYYQDSQTGRLMLLTPDLQTREAMPGAFDTFASGAQVLTAIHVESKRQVWFVVNGAPNSILVLDYKHKTDKSPFGQEYTWPVFQHVNDIVGSAMVGAAPLLVELTGETSVQTQGQYYDLRSNGTTSYACNRVFETGEIAPFGLQRMFNVSRLAVLAAYSSAHNLTLLVYPNYSASAVPHSKDITAESAQVVMRPQLCMRIQSLRVRAVEGTYSQGGNPVMGAGSTFVGLALELQDQGRLQLMPVGRIL